MERIRWMPATNGGPGTYIQFGPHDRKGYKGDFLTIRELRGGELRFDGYHRPEWPSQPRRLRDEGLHPRADRHHRAQPRPVHAPHDGQLVPGRARASATSCASACGPPSARPALARGREHVGARRLGRPGRQLRPRDRRRPRPGPVAGRVVGGGRVAPPRRRRPHRRARRRGPASVEELMRRRRARRGVRPRAGHRAAGHEPASCSTRSREGGRPAVRGARARAGRAPTRWPWPTTPRRIADLGHPGLGDVGRLRAGVGARRRAGRLAQDAARPRRPLAAPAARRPAAHPAAHRPPARRRPTAARSTRSDGRAADRPSSPTRASTASAPGSTCPSRGRSRRTTASSPPTRSATWPRPTATTTRCGATRPTAPPPAGAGRSPRRRSSAATPSIGDDEVTEVAERPAGAHEGRPAARRPRLLPGSAREWWAPLVPGHARHPPQRAGRRARQAERVRRAGGARVVGAGVPRRRRPAAVGPAPQHDPHRAHQGARAQEVRRRSRSRAYTDDEIEAIEAQYAAEAPRAPSRAGGRTSQEGDDGRPAGEGPVPRHRHDLLARRHGHGPLRREAAAAGGPATGGASPASSTATRSTSPT